MVSPKEAYQILKVLLVLVFFAGFLSPPGRAQTLPAFQENYQDLLTSGFTKVYAYNFPEAENILHLLEKKFPNQAMNPILGMNIIWWQTLSGQESKDYPARIQGYTKRLQHHFEQQEKQGKRLTHPDQYVRILAASLRGRFHLHHHHPVGATEALRECVKYLKASQGQENTFAPYYLTSGLYQYLSAYTREKPLYYMLSLYLSGGNKARGKAFLKQGEKSPQLVVATESTYFLMMIHGELENNWEEAEKYARQLTNRYPQNLWYQYFYFKSLLRQKKEPEARQRYRILSEKALQNKALSSIQQEHFLRIAREELAEAE